MKNLLKRIIPKSLISLYHFLLAILANIIYGFPSRQLTVIGVTGTTGKSTTVNLIAKVLQEAGLKVGLTSTYNYKIGDKEWINDTKMTMPGRFQLQKMLRKMVKAGCSHLVIETSSEGIAQYRHLGIDYNMAVLTNLSPEHIESHGSFKNYRKAKGKLFALLGKSKSKGRKISVVNLDSDQADYFLQFFADQKWGYAIKQEGKESQDNNNVVFAEDVNLKSWGSRFLVRGQRFNFDLVGQFNIYNALAAVCVGLSLGIDLKVIEQGLDKIKKIEGRVEEVDQGQQFKVIVDYAHEPKSLENLYQALRPTTTGKIIAVLGSCGGGRDKARRPILGRLAAQFADQVIVTNEDPYDEDPQIIIDQVIKGAVESGKQLDENLFSLLDRRQAIKKALSLADPHDLVIITGKGAEQCIMEKGGTRIPWDDRQVVREELNNLE
ncbi:UDP-N-acetylmuramoyl-L-alanyl-D-glutamate--2,6-diaminopimelate ligase [Patescibacteria group bacterium]|nr:UDP-N-acetylmuramoyl-L-alanyl-D-glutamate--2,6-diaminopimelate ligase [Patescibacteria group bacterium]